MPGCWTRHELAIGRAHERDRAVARRLTLQRGRNRTPAGLYDRLVEVPESWLDREVALHVGGSESSAVVWCNSDFIGMGKDSRLPSEFDVIGSLRLGGNKIDVMVLRYSDATWIEDQDHWCTLGCTAVCFLRLGRWLGWMMSQPLLTMTRRSGTARSMSNLRSSATVATQCAILFDGDDQESLGRSNWRRRLPTDHVRVQPCHGQLEWFRARLCPSLL